MGSELGNTADTKAEARLDGLGVFYLVLAVTWTATLFGAMIYLWRRRSAAPALRVRGLPVSFAGVLFLHGYWCCVTTGYVYGPLMPEVIEYWIMGLWLPLGIALFHASNARFLYVAAAQRRYARRSGLEPLRIFTRRPGRISLRESVRVWWGQLDYSRKTLAGVAIGMSLHVCLTLLMFLASRKFHDSFGLNGTQIAPGSTPMQIKAAQGTGWEWWPSIFWQFFWAWIVAPLVLFRARHIHDTQGWRLQTIGCCLSSLHAAPLWLVALYVPAMEAVNRYWIPPMWIGLSIILLEIFTVFVPLWEVRKQRNLNQETLESIARWESRQRLNGNHGDDKYYHGLRKDVKSLYSETSSTTWASRMSRAASSLSSSSSSAGSSSGSILTMDALEHTLAKNPEPLQEFSALKDFSGENVAFLMRVRDWRAAHHIVSTPKTLGGQRRSQQQLQKDEKSSLSPPPTPIKVVSREMFDDALHIYLDFISTTCAEFQINLSSQDFRRLEGVFEKAASLVINEESRTVNGDGSNQTVASAGLTEDHAFDPVTPFSDSSLGVAATNSTASSVIRYTGPIPEGFDENVFTDAELSIKYLILTNTWPKFVRQRRSFDATSTAETV